MEWTLIDGVNVATSALVVGAAWLFRRRRVLAAFLAFTGAAWALQFLPATGAPSLEVWRPVFFSLFLAVASAALVVLAVDGSGRRPPWIAAGAAGAATATAMFVGRAAAILDPWADVVPRAVRDLANGTYVFALVVFALAARAQEGRAYLASASFALVLYPGVVAGIYLHPESHRVMAGLFLALLGIAALWIRNTLTADALASRRALVVALACLAVPLVALATVRLQGGLEAAAEGPLRALARAGGPLLFAYVWARSKPDVHGG